MWKVGAKYFAKSLCVFEMDAESAVRLLVVEFGELSALRRFSLSLNQINSLPFSLLVSLSHSLYSTPSEILISLSWLPRGLEAAAAAGHHCRQAAASCEEGTSRLPAQSDSARAFSSATSFPTTRRANTLARCLPQVQSASFQIQPRAGLSWSTRVFVTL